jgi:type I restriction enzyme, S subunit
MSAPPLSAIGDHVDSVSSWMPERDDPNGVFTYVDLSAVDQDAKVVSGAREIACAEAPTRARQLIRAGDVLVSTVRPNLNGVALVPPELDGATASTGFCVLRPRASQLDARYLYQWVKSPRFVSDMVRKATGASYPAVSDRIICESKLPLLPLLEQRRTAEILDKADSLRAKRRAALTQLDTLTQSIFLDMFGDPSTNPKGWPTVNFGKVCETRLGKMLDQKKQTGEHRRAYLRNANVQWFRFDLTSLLEMDFDEEDRKALRLEPGDLLICEGGEPGRAAVWRGALDECYFQKALHRARPDPHFANSEYLSWLLWFLAQRGQLSGVTSATIAHLTGEKLAVLPTMLPPLSSQIEFARILSQMHGLERGHLAASAELDSLVASLQHRAFRGEL